MKIKVLYEDTNILAIDKPSGILVHPAPEHPSSRAKLTTGQRVRHGAGSDKSTILSIFLKKYPKLEVVHRLDRDTSGVMLLAKNKKAHEFLKKQFQDRTIKKTYYTIVSGWVKNDRGIINKPIGRSPKDFRRHLAGRGARGEMREAITEYKVLKRFKAKAYQNFYLRGSRPVLGEGRRRKNFDVLDQLPFTYLEVKPKTGRTHQIRVHMKFLNHPVVCDLLYNPDGFCPKGISRMALHAKSIEFENLKGKTVKVESTVPKEFGKVIK
ncbi:MAG: RluA family pseudouridine synthase [Candidatus Paceibacterota bacterium]|jgi:23S rRNA pseudouridine1911/1915/1917 synthase